MRKLIVLMALILNSCGKNNQYQASPLKTDLNDDFSAQNANLNEPSGWSNRRDWNTFYWGDRFSLSPETPRLHIYWENNFTLSELSIINFTKVCSINPALNLALYPNKFLKIKKDNDSCTIEIISYLPAFKMAY